MDVFLAHNGPVYSMQFSPFCSKIFLTCGADWCVRIWSEDVVQPLVTLNTSMETMQGAAWSPVNATIIASISGNDIHLWDIKHKIFVPASTTTSPTDTGNLMIQFTASGLNLVVGDGDGAVHVYGLQDMPFSPFYQEVALIQAIKKALVTRPELLEVLKKIGKPFY
jgi:WD40 repeat protein